MGLAVDYTVNEPLLGGTTPVLSTVTRNTQYGREEYGKQMINNVYSPVLINDNPCSDVQSDYSITWDDKGDEMDAYNLNYDEIFSPYSNPASNSCSNPTTNTGLTFDLISQDTSGAITLKIYFNNDSALAQLPPSKPKNVKGTKQYFGGTGSGTYHPHISWDQNIEPDFYNALPDQGPNGVAPVYEIYRGSSTDCGAVPTYTLLTTVATNVTSYTDIYVTLYDPNQPYTQCTPELGTYSYKIVAKDNRGLRSLKSERALVSGYVHGCSADGETRTSVNSSPDKFSVTNYPNPFNPVTKIYYTIPIEGNVKITIYNALGQKVEELINELKVAGSYTIDFNGNDFGSGIYFYRFEAPGFMQTRKLMLLK